MTYTIEHITTVNPYGKSDTVARVTTDTHRASLVIDNAFLPTATEYVFAIWIYSASPHKITISYVKNLETVSEEFEVSGWRRLSVKPKHTESITDDQIEIQIPANATIYFYEALSVTGTTLTDWAPSPADTREEIDGVQNAANNAQTSADNAQNTADNALFKANENAENLSNFANAVTEDVANLQSQIDGNITSWFYSHEPTTSNEPASSWTTTALKDQHLGDLFYIVDNESKNGQTYRWVLQNGTYKWLLLSDAEVTKALADAAKAQDTADKKRRTFISQPTPPYDTGDIWMQGSSGDIMVCVTSRASGSYAASDWSKQNKYTDDTAVENMSIGGRNLVRNSNFSNELAMWESFGSPNTVEVVSDDGRNWCHYIANGTATENGIWQIVSVDNSGKIEAGKTYQLSLKIKGANANQRLLVGLEWLDDTDTIIDQVAHRRTGISTLEILFSISDDAPTGATKAKVKIYAGGYAGAMPYELYFTDIKLEKGTKSTDWTPAPEDLQSDIDSSAEALRTMITEQKTEILSEAGANTLSALTNYITADEFGVYRSEAETQLTQTSKDFKLEIDRVESTVSADVDSKFEKYNKAFKFTETGLEISSENSKVTLSIDNDDGIAFKYNGQIFGYWNGDNFYTGNIHVRVDEQARFGDYAFLPRQDGSLMFRKIT